MKSFVPASLPWTLFFCLCLPADLGVSGLHFLGFEATISGRVQARVGLLDPMSGATTFGRGSQAYEAPQYLCVNAAWNRGADRPLAFVLWTKNAYQVLEADNGTIAEGTFKLQGESIAYETVSWIYNSEVRAFVVLGWRKKKISASSSSWSASLGPNNERNNNSVPSRGFVADADGEPQVALVNITSGELQVVASVRGSAFLLCACASGGPWFHYAYLDDVTAEQHTMSLHLVNGTQVSILFPMQKYGVIMSISTAVGADFHFVVVTDQGIAFLFAFSIGLFFPIYTVDQTKATVGLDAAYLSKSVLLYALLASRDGPSMLLATMDKKEITYQTVETGNCTLGLSNLAL